MKHLLATIGILSAITTMLGCSASCGNEPVASIPSPSGKNKAIVFSRNCGATTGFNTQVSIAGGKEALPSEGGNALILGGTVPLQIHWVSESRLSITGVGPAQVFKRVSVVSGIAIAYE